MNIRAFLVIIVAIVISLIIITNVITGHGNNIAALAKTFAVISLIAGVTLQRFGVYLLIVYGACSDMIKRMLVIEGNFSSIDITYILMMSPLLMFGIFLGASADALLKRDITRLQWVALFFAFFLGGINFTVGGGSGAIGLLQSGANVVSYFFLPFCILRSYKTLDDYLKVVKFAVIVFIPVAIHGIGQGLFGYGGFEYRYLVSGFTTIVNFPDVDATRPFSTTASPASFAYLSGIMGVTVITLSVIGAQRSRALNFSKVLAISMAFIFLWGCFISQSRGAILASICTLPLFFVIKNYRLTIMAYLLGLVTLLTLFASSGYILREGLLKQFQKDVVPHIVDFTGLDSRYFTLATMHVRLEGWDNMLSNPEFHKPFGNRALLKRTEGLSKREQKVLGLRSHDLISKMLLKAGWVPFLSMLILGGSLLFKVHRLIADLPKNSKESRCARLGLVALVAVYVTTITGSAIGAYPICLVANLLLPLCYLAIRDNKRLAIQSQIDVQEEQAVANELRVIS